MTGGHRYYKGKCPSPGSGRISTRRQEPRPCFSPGPDPMPELKKLLERAGVEYCECELGGDELPFEASRLCFESPRGTVKCSFSPLSLGYGEGLAEVESDSDTCPRAMGARTVLAEYMNGGW